MDNLTTLNKRVLVKTFGADVKYLNHNQTETLVEYLYKFKNK